MARPRQKNAAAPGEPAPEGFRLAAILGTLSLATDAAAGFAPETALRTAIIAVRLAACAGLPAHDQRNAYYAGVLRYLGCTGYAPEQAQLNGGDDLGFLQIYADRDLGSAVQMAARTITSLAANQPLLPRAVSIAKFLGNPALARDVSSIHCGAAAMLAEQIGMEPGVLQPLQQMYERWDGRGQPESLRSPALHPVAPVLHIAQVAAVFQKVSGASGAVAALLRRSGGQLDPILTQLACDNYGDLIHRDAGLTTLELFLGLEPQPHWLVPPLELPRIARAFGAFADLKSAYMLGHSQRVSQTCGLSAMAVGLNSEKSAELQLAAHVHDLGRVTIASGTWDRPGPLTAYERESLRAHPSMMRSFLNQIPPLRSVAALASTACERLDGSGYPRGLASSLLGPAERLLAAADVFVALTSDRPHRPAFSRTMAARLMGEDVSAGRLDRRSVNAVLDGAEVRRPKLQIALPDSLSLREAEVILLLAQGLKNKDIALRLNISPRTVQTHVAHIFDKTGFRSRAGAALYSIRHGLADIQHFDG